MCEFTLANVELSTVGAGGHGVALTQAATAQGWVVGGRGRVLRELHPTEL